MSGRKMHEQDRRKVYQGIILQSQAEDIRCRGSGEAVAKTGMAGKGDRAAAAHG